MSNVFGQNIRLSIFGESHGSGIGIVIGGLPHGIRISFEDIKAQMARRAPGNSELATPRAEADEAEVLSGLLDGVTTGAPLCALIRNTDARSEDYRTHVLRPGHADLGAWHKYHGFSDGRGGGHFSGRLSAPLVFAGAIARQILQKRNVAIGARILSIGGIRDAVADADDIIAASQKPFPAVNNACAQSMRDAIRAAKEEGDSVGGVVECAAIHVPGALGEPFFDSMESVIAHMMFSIPGVKGVEFGAGFSIAAMKGSEANDAMRVDGGQISLLSNHCGGINGGITNGAPIIFRVAFRPTPTIAKPQPSVDINAFEDAVAKGKGRHDPCIAVRAVPVVEAGLALCLLDQMMCEKPFSEMR